MFYKKKSITVKKQYHLLGNLKFNLISAKTWNSYLFYFQFLCVFPSILSGYVAALLPAKLVESLEIKTDIGRLLGTIIILMGIMWLCDTIYKAMYQYLYRNSMSLALYYDKLCFRKMMQIEYDRLEIPEHQTLIKNVWNVLRNEFAIRNSVTGMPDLLIAVLSTVWYGILLFAKNPLIILIELLCVAVSYLMVLRSRKVYTQKSKEVGAFSKEGAYINRQAMDRAAGKDIRIFQMQDLFLSKYKHAIKGMNGVYDYIHNSYILQGFVTNVMIFISYIFPHGYLLYLLMIKKTFTVSEFVLYSNIIGQFSGHVYSMLNGLRSLNPVSASIEHLRRFLDLEESMKKNGGIGQQRVNQMLRKGVK